MITFHINKNKNYRYNAKYDDAKFLKNILISTNFTDLFYTYIIRNELLK